MTRREKGCFFEAVILLAIASACVRFVAFKHIDKFLRSHWSNRTQQNVSQEQEVGLVQASVMRATKALPWNVLCLSQSIAEYLMLRRRGFSAAIVAGVKVSTNRLLDAHAWVDRSFPMDGRRHENSSYTVVMRISPNVVDR